MVIALASSSIGLNSQRANRAELRQHVLLMTAIVVEETYNAADPPDEFDEDSVNDQITLACAEQPETFLIIDTSVR